MSIKYVPRRRAIMPGEIPMKQWVHAEALREGVRPNAIYNRISRGLYPNMAVRRVNKRVIFVSEKL